MPLSHLVKQLRESNLGYADMSDKGGKGFSGFPNGKGSDKAAKGFSALPNGKAKSKNVQFASQGKEGKGSAGGAKSQEPLQLKVENELPKGAQCLMDCEAADILQGIQDQMVILSKDPSIKLPVSFDRGLQYTKKSTSYTDPKSVRKVLENLKTYGVTDGEICVIANVYPDTADEVFALLPSLKARRIMLDGAVDDVLSELAKLKKSA